MKRKVPDLNSSIERRLQIEWSIDGFSFVLREMREENQVVELIRLFLLWCGVAGLAMAIPAWWGGFLPVAFLTLPVVLFFVVLLSLVLSWMQLWKYKSVKVLVDGRGIELHDEKFPWSDVGVEQIGFNNLAVNEYLLVHLGPAADLRWLCAYLAQIRGEVNYPGNSHDIPRELGEVVSKAAGPTGTRRQGVGDENR
ncbi:MAG: hypothetical protein HN348_27615 [Proteobacteria bacterium]|nr:hypothetical protein [Pseudomonadota bacterium]